MDWNEIGSDSRHAAAALRDTRFRSAVSRAYYAAFSAVTQALLDRGVQFPPGFNTPPHHDVPRLIGLHLTDLGAARVRDLRAAVRRLYAARLAADYNGRVTTDAAVARSSVRDAASVFQMVGVPE